MTHIIALIAVVKDEYELIENTQIIESYPFVIQRKSSFRTEFTLLFHSQHGLASYCPAKSLWRSLVLCRTSNSSLRALLLARR